MKKWQQDLYCKIKFFNFELPLVEKYCLEKKNETQ
jgi:hypothetical protein